MFNSMILANYLCRLNPVQKQVMVKENMNMHVLHPHGPKRKLFLHKYLAHYASVHSCVILES